MKSIYSLLAGALLASQTLVASTLMSPTSFSDAVYDKPILSGEYDPKVAPPTQFTGVTPGQRVATPEQISRAVLAWSEQSERMQAFEYARTYEGRPLYYVLISSPDNLAKADQVKQDIQRLANPEGLSRSAANELIGNLPGVAWMAYSIHGNESSGADAALLAMYHLAASQQSDVKAMLDDLIIIIDPMMNPDGRARFAKELEETRGVAANVDDQSILHQGSWPYGRTNHYYFDLNRDFILGTQPETRGRVSVINQWYPQLMIDGHEMGPQDTYLFAPAREPINRHLPAARKRWGEQFAKDQAAAFDQQGWRYYTGEWFENLYPGYSSYAEFRGSVHILYEQARIAEDGIRRPEGTVLTYAESVHHQFISTIANLSTLQKNSKEIYRDFYDERRASISSSGPYADRSFVIMPSNNTTRMKQFLELMALQNIKVMQTEKARSIAGIDQFGRQVGSIDIPAGAYVIQNRQSEARLIAAILEFDAEISQEVLKEERQLTLRDGSSIMYDTTAWNLTMMYGLEAYTVERHIDRGLIEPSWSVPTNQLTADTAIAYGINGEDDAAVAFAARMMEQGAQLRAIDKATTLGETSLSRGSVILTRTDNREFADMAQLAIQTANELGVALLPISAGMGLGDLPDWGGRHFRLLARPQIAVMARGNFSPYSVGEVWHALDKHLGVRHTKLNADNVGYSDLRRYNVIIMPSAYRESLSGRAYDALEQWVKAGGTLIAIDGSARHVISRGLSKVRTLSNAFEDAETFDLSLQREWLAMHDEVDMQQVTSNLMPTDIAYPFDIDVSRLSEEQLKQRDQWQSRFMPSGAMVAARSDQLHWLSFGVAENLPLLFQNHPLLMSDDSTEAVTRIGVFAEPKGTLSKLADSVGTDDSALGWYSLLPERGLLVRMSGLLWPEAAQRIAHTAATTRESSGLGQIILFANRPNFRGSAKNSNRMLLNAIVYGPGLGSELTINL